MYHWRVNRTRCSGSFRKRVDRAGGWGSSPPLSARFSGTLDRLTSSIEKPRGLSILFPQCFCRTLRGVTSPSIWAISLVVERRMRRKVAGDVGSIPTFLHRVTFSCNVAGVVQWQNAWLPIRRRGFDSPHPLQFRSCSFPIGKITAVLAGFGPCFSRSGMFVRVAQLVEAPDLKLESEGSNPSADSMPPKHCWRCTALVMRGHSVRFREGAPI